MGEREGTKQLYRRLHAFRRFRAHRRLRVHELLRFYRRLRMHPRIRHARFHAHTGSWIAALVLQTSAVVVVSGQSTTALKPIEIADETGFEQPVTAFRLLAPAGWTVEGGVRWNPGFECLGDMVTTSLRITSPDGHTAFEMFPTYYASWDSDPMFQGLMRQTGRDSAGCEARPPFDARGFLAEVLIPTERAGAHVRAVSHDQATARIQQQRAEELFAPRLTGFRVEADAAAARIEYTQAGDRYDELIVASTLIIAFPGITGAMMYSSAAERVFGIRAPAGELEAAEALFATMLASFRPNPAWVRAVERVSSNISRIRMEGAAERSRIWRSTMDEISDMRMESWRRSQASRDRVAESFSRSIRDVDLYVDPITGDTFEFEIGTTYVWSNGYEEYIPTDDPDYDPNWARSDSGWRRYEVQR